MDSCYSDNIAKDHLHPDTTKRNIEEPQQRNRLGTVGHWLLGELKHVLLGPHLAHCFRNASTRLKQLQPTQQTNVNI